MPRSCLSGFAVALAAAIAGLSGVQSAWAVEAVDGAQPGKSEPRFEDRQVPILSWSKDVAANGCRLHEAPIPFSKDALFSLAEVPFWELIQHHVGPRSVRATLDPPEKYAQSLEPLDPDLRTLTLLHVLWDGLGRDGLHTYFYLESGNTAPAVRDALQAAGLAREHALFTEAMALFGDAYPLDDGVRAKSFGYATPSQKLNAFDHRLLALSKEFGSRDKWTEIIVGYVNRTPALWQRIEAVRVTLSDARRLEVLTTALMANVDPWKPYTEIQPKLAALAKEQRTLLAVGAFNLEFENGGVHQFFYNSGGAFAPDVQEALAEMGLGRQADLIKRGIGMFAAPYPRDTEQRRETHFHNHDGWTDWDRQLSELTDAFYALDGGPQVLHMGGDLQIEGGPGLRHGMLGYARVHNMLPC